MLIFCIVRKTGLILLPLADLTAGREAGRQVGRLVDEIQVGFDISLQDKLFRLFSIITAILLQY